MTLTGQAKIQIQNPIECISINTENVNLDLKSIELPNDEISSKASDLVISEEPTSQNEEPINAAETEEDDSWCPESKTEQFFCVLGVIIVIACLPIVGCYAITCGKMSDENE